MASVDKSLDAANIDDNAETDATSSCLNDPNYAIICVFLQKFGGQLKIEHPDFLRLQKMIENTDEVHDELKQFFVKLLRKTRKSVQPDKLDSALAKFCYTYSAQDAWEVERFGYKKSSLAVKLRILKEVLESQFDKNPNFRTLISAQTAAELRSQPLGKDKLGNAYWSIVDEQCNLRIYQEHLDEEIWKVVATNRDEMAKLITCLRGNELVMPSLVGIIDEDSSSNSMPAKVDALQNENGTNNTTNDSDDKNVPCLKIKLNSNGGESTVEQISNSDNTNGAKNPSQNDSIEDDDGEEEEEDASIMSEIDEQSQAASESSATTVGTKSNETQGSKRISLMASKPPSNANKLKLRIFATDTKTTKRSLDDDSDTAGSKNKRPAMQDKKNGEDDDSEFDSEEMSDEELDESGNEGSIGQAIEEPTMYVQGEGSGTDNNCENTMWLDCYNDECDDNDVGESIEEEIIYVFGEGSGRDCDVGNNDIKSTETPPSSSATTAPPQPVVQSKPMFFFGTAGCLKLSPMKPVVTAEDSSATHENKNDIENEKCQESSSSSIANESSTNDTNSIALDAKSECSAPENTANSTDETDKGISINNETVAILANEPQNNVGDKIDSTSTSKNDSTTNENKTQIEATTHADEQLNVTASSESSSAATIANESSKENIESNSSVALAKISVQESESIEEESLPTTSTVLQIESDLLSNDRENDSCLEKQWPEPRVPNDKVAIENQSENKLNESSEIVNETNDLANKSELENDNQSSVSQFENEPSGEQAIEFPTSKTDVIAEINEPSEQVQETNDLTERIESDVTPLVEEEVPQKTENECSNVVDNESNNQVKTDSPNEQNAIDSEPIGKLSPVQETSEQSVSNVIEETECKELENNPPTSIETPIELPKQIENTIQDETPSEQTAELIEAEETPKQPEVTSAPIESHNEQPPLSHESIEQQIEEQSEERIESPSTPIESVVNESPKTPLNEIDHEEPELEPEPISNETIDSESIPSDIIESTSIACEPEAIEQNKSEKEVVSIEVSDLVSESQPEQSKSEDALEDQNVAEPQTTTTTELMPVPVIEKRKSIDQIEEASERKKICEEKVTEEFEQPPTLEEEKPIEIPSISQLEPCVSNSAEEYAEITDKNEIAQSDFNAAEVPNQLEATKSLGEVTLIASNKEESSTDSVETKVDIWHETSKIDQADLPDKVLVASVVSEVPAIVSEKEPVSIETNVETTEVTETQESVSIVQKDQKEEDATQNTRSAQLRNRKRRISGEKARHSSESDDNNDALIESPLSQDASSDEEVGGKRIKMRPKTVKRTLRKSVEQKRNIKDTDWSSDENEKPNAKRATNDISKQTENILPSPEQNAPDVKEKKPSPIKEESVGPAEKKVEAPSASEETKIKAEEPEEPAEHQSDEEQATPTRRPGRPARRGRKPGPKPKQKPVEEVKVDEIKEESKEETTEQTECMKEEKIETPSIKPETRRKKRSLLGLDIAEIESAQASIDETPVRQSRRIAQIKIREEAERRKAEEVALQKMKEASEKKKKGVVVKESESEEENSESEVKLEKKKRLKKVNKDKPWQTNSDDSSEREEEDVYEHEDVERLPPLGSDHEFSPESDIEDESQIVPTKRARTARKDKTERREEESEEEEDIHACQKCSKSDHPEWILLCDKCDKGYHCSCLIPVLFVIPEGDWFCPPCQQDKLIDQLEAKLIEYDNMVQQKEIEEAQRQRLLLTTISEANVIKDTRRDRQRSRAQDIGSDDTDESSSTDEESEAEGKANNSERRTRPRTERQRNRIESSEHSSSDNTSDNEPIYKLRKRRQANVSYRFNEYDELINRAIKSEMDEVAGAGNLGRGKDISTIIDAVKEEKRLKKLEEQQKERELAGETKKNDDKDDDGNDNDSDDQPLKSKADKSDGSDSEPIRPKAIKRSKNISKKKKKLNSLDIDSEEDADSSDDDFNTSSYSDDEEEDDSSAPSESSLDSIVKKKRKGRGGISTRRSVRERKKRYDADFIDDSSFDDEDNVPLVKKKKKVESDFDEFDDSSEELEEDVDSDDLCDDSTDESDRSWGKKKKKASSFKSSGNNKNRKKKPDGERSFKGKTAKKKSKISDDDDDDDTDEEYGDEVLPKSRRTRGKKLPYLLDDDFDSSDDGIKPGVKRPDTPPEERAAFIKKQEEIKRMLAEKENDDKSLQIPPPQNDSLSTIPPQIIQSAKALDVDLKKSAILHRNASDNDSNGFDDDLPEDFDPEDMDEDAIAKMMEEEEFAQQQLKLAGETIRNRKLKDALTDPMKKDDSPTKLTIETGASVILPVNIPPSLVSPLPLTASQLTIPDIPPSMYTAQFQGANSKQTTTPKKRGRKTKDDISPIIAPLSKEPHPQIPTIQHTSILTPNKPNTPLNMPSVLQHALTPQLFTSPTIQHTSSVIAHSSVIQQQQPPRLPPMQQTAASAMLGLAQARDHIIPSTLNVQNTRLLDPSELGKPPEDLLDPSAKKRARSRKKITPTRESLTSPPNVTVSPGGITQSTPVTIPNVPNVSKPPSSILSERLSANPVDKAGLSIATPPSLYSASSRSQASVITRLTRPSQRQPFPSGQSPPQRYYAPNTSMPPHSIPSTATGAHSRPYHTPNVTVASGQRPPPLVPPPHASSHLPPHPMRGQPGIYGGYPNIQPPPMHRSLQSLEHATNSPQNFPGAYQNLPFGGYYAAAAAADRRSGAIIGTFEPFDNKNPSAHDRLPAYAHPSLGLAALAGRNPTGDGDDERGQPGAGGSTSEFSGLVSYFSSQQDDLDS
ncbi:titin homolog isoform X2 [Contarinia nasturtii]|uniref:titin homolog isoform X2 n=1 Tax=Contarinia nasturtii TaxID=265458 RepID=UPI0012D498B2|nr:titin homolog isoform X2 [Contarinia nasturtii]